jgi:cytosine/adenosine deaminase-related metal-dependent hydrolase
MIRLSARFIITNTGSVLENAVIEAGDDGTIISVSENYAADSDNQSVEFFNGIIIPGFINCHCHLELSHLRGTIPGGTGLPEFIMNIRSRRDNKETESLFTPDQADAMLHSEGTMMCADISNTAETFALKKKSRIRYLTLLEVFGIDPEKADRRMKEILVVAEEAEKQGLPYYLVPHSAYSVSLPLFRMLMKKTTVNRVSSIHFMESESEASFLSGNSGALRESYRSSGLLPEVLQTPVSHEEAIMDYVTRTGNLILVHNTFADATTVRKINSRGNTFWCLCPESNIFIEGKMPPADMLADEGCDIVIGTDSPASGKEFSILSQLKLIQEHFPGIGLEELIRWATLNGARALCADDKLGSIAEGKKPGLLLLENPDPGNFKLLPGTTVRRIL